MHPYQHAITHPTRPALVIADTGEQLNYRELDEGSNRAAQLFRQLGLRPGESIGLMLRNSLEYAVLYWGAQRAGLLIAILSSHLKATEAAYILNDCAAKLLIATAEVGSTPVELADRRSELIPRLEAVFLRRRQAAGGRAPARARARGDACHADRGSGVGPLSALFERNDRTPERNPATVQTRSDRGGRAIRGDAHARGNRSAGDLQRGAPSSLCALGRNAGDAAPGRNGRDAAQV